MQSYQRFSLSRLDRIRFCILCLLCTTVGPWFQRPWYPIDAYNIPSWFGTILLVNTGEACAQKFNSVVSWCTYNCRGFQRGFIKKKKKKKWSAIYSLSPCSAAWAPGQHRPGRVQDRNLDERGMNGWSLARSDPDLPVPNVQLPAQDPSTWSYLLQMRLRESLTGLRPTGYLTQALALHARATSVRACKCILQTA